MAHKSGCISSICMPLGREEEARVPAPAERGNTGVGRREITLDLGCWLDHGGEMLQALEAFALALAAEIEDEFTNPEAAIRGNVRDDLLCGAGEGPTCEPGLPLCGQRDIIKWGFIGDC